MIQQASVQITDQEIKGALQSLIFCFCFLESSNLLIQWISIHLEKTGREPAVEINWNW